uniref:Ribonuclease H-like domain-containing protein n=1 Tax=Tanacetum cinerariifolium TaxID=118510 RepID=A0A6L2LIG9_TANCI|nr:ribonuclease H-like domain-containing protein [Tanacetum cinerariifolium]
MRDGKWTRPAGFEFARENLQSRVKEEDSFTDFEDQSLHVLGPSRLCAQAQSRDDMLFHKQAYMRYTQLVFCKLFGMPRERHLACPTKMHGSLLLSFQEGSKSGKENFQKFANYSSVICGERLRFHPFRQVVDSYDTEDLYLVIKPSPVPHAFLTSQYTWHQRLGHPKSKVLRHILSSNSISCNKEKPPILCHACQLGKHVRLPFKEFSMTNIGSLNYLLGISVTPDSLGMFLSQCKYAYDILERVLMVSCNSSKTPVDTESKLGDHGDLVCLYIHDPQEPHFLALKRILRYVRDAKYRGVANAVAETCWLRNLLRKLHTPLSFATLVYCDNVSAICLSFNTIQHQPTKHIEIDIHFVQDLVAAGEVRVLHV